MIPGPGNYKESQVKFIVTPNQTVQGKRITLCILCSEDPRWCGNPL